ncbi:hypothetical protein XINFAN_02789 [Pseudogemmobacter humi]|uniref:Uncharacterized protein n=1 Tax=Pseudogemmobacter humi TaxID=2483812 RepID=A0A3P5X9N3_9RHOB|nr:hypothetical protein XINFAN_02789 [Pseudogemmobacter humi]
MIRSIDFMADRLEYISGKLRNRAEIRGIAIRHPTLTDPQHRALQPHRPS